MTGPHPLTDVGMQRGWWYHETVSRQCWADDRNTYQRQCQAWEVDDSGLCAYHRHDILGR